MNKKYYSLKSAIILPFVLLITLILSVEAVIWKLDYDFLAKEQGSKIVSALNETTQERLRILLEQPLNANMVISKELLYKELDGEDLEGIENYLFRIYSALGDAIPQVSVTGYGDEQGRYIGFRKTDVGYDLMVKDSRTDGDLIIYDGITMKDDIIASYEGYDPRGRPWYVPVKENPIPQWSDIYVNYDEIMEATITFLAPVIEDNGTFKGVMAGDIKLTGINDFLKNDQTKGSGAIYIIDQSNNIIAHSGEEEVILTEEGDPPTGTLMQATDSSNTLISQSAGLVTSDFVLDEVLQQKINGDQHYMLVSKMRSPANLNWRIVIVIPESDMMGQVAARNIWTFSVLILIAIIAFIFGLVLINRITNPIIGSTKTAMEIASGNWSAKQPKTAIHVKEIQDLSESIDIMGDNIKESFKQIKYNEDRLEYLVAQQREELELAMAELLNKEKLASLGSLVSGISHEINTPLGVAVSATSLLEQNTEKATEHMIAGNMTKEELITYMDNVVETSTILSKNLDRASDLIKSFKNIAVNQSVERKSTFNVSDYIHSLLLSLKHEYKKKDHTFEVICEPDLVIHSYSGSISQILTNLIMNSIIHAFKDIAGGHITIQVVNHPDRLTLIYRDNGRGMDEETRKRVFEPFFTTNRNQGGSGLGLNIVYNLVTGQLNGNISCESSINIGTTFTIEFEKE
jgi:signal transduction histidine kinase